MVLTARIGRTAIVAGLMLSSLSSSIALASLATSTATAAGDVASVESVSDQMSMYEDESPFLSIKSDFTPGPAAAWRILLSSKPLLPSSSSSSDGIVGGLGQQQQDHQVALLDEQNDEQLGGSRKQMERPVNLIATDFPREQSPPSEEKPHVRRLLRSQPQRKVDCSRNGQIQYCEETMGYLSAGIVVKGPAYSPPGTRFCLRSDSHHYAINYQASYRVTCSSGSQGTINCCTAKFTMPYSR